MKKLTEFQKLDVQDIVFDKVVSHTAKKTKTPYQRIPILVNYGGGDFGALIIRTPPCWTCGVRTDLVDGGGFRYTLPLMLFDKPLPTKLQELWVKAFFNIVKVAKEELLERGYNEERLGKLASCMWEGTAGPIMYVGLVDSPYNDEYSSRFFINDIEVSKEQVTGSYDVVAAVRVDSIYIGEKTISIQVRLYEVDLVEREKRERIL